MSTDAERREEARLETIDEQLERRGVRCEDCGNAWVPGRGCCPRCGGAIAEESGVMGPRVYTADGHRLVAWIERVKSPHQPGRLWSDLRHDIECPGPPACQAQSLYETGVCNLRDWAAAVGMQDFVESMLEGGKPMRAELPVEIEYRWDGWGEEAEPKFRPRPAPLDGDHVTPESTEKPGQAPAPPPSNTPTP